MSMLSFLISCSIFAPRYALLAEIFRALSAQKSPFEIGLAALELTWWNLMESGGK
jgi:hypothetical protein